MPAQSKTKLAATLIPGDGIGPEIVKSAVDILEALGSPFEWDIQQGGLAAIEESRDPLPQATLDSIRRTRLALKGPLTTPVGGGFRSVNVRLREEFGLYANLRPVKTMVPGGRYEDIDLVLVRENIEGLYVAFEHFIAVGDDPHAVAISSGVNTHAEARRIVRFAFEYALAHDRKKVTVVHKANVLKALTGLFLQAGREIAKEYEGRVVMDDRIVDACAMQLVMNPWQFDASSRPICSATSCPTRCPASSAASAWRRAPISARRPRSSRRCTARRRILRARGLPIRSRSCWQQR